MNRKKKSDRQADIEKDMLLDPEKSERQKRKKRLHIAVTLLWGVIMAAGIIMASFEVVRAIGKSSLQSKVQNDVPELEPLYEKEALTDQEKEEWKEGWIKYENQIYAYNEDILTFLFMGIDKSDEVRKVEEGTNGGQADALFLLVLNPHDKSIRVIGINRNTMADIDLYNEEGAYMTTITAQLAVQHGFGNGVEESCEYQVNAVRRLFYNLPIHGYCAVNMDAVIELTNLIGGVTLTSLEDVRTAFINENPGDYVVKEGEDVMLDGRMAYSYVRFRDVNATGSSDKRLERQKQFLEKFIQKTIRATKEDISIPVKFYNAISSQMVTDVTVDEVAYLAPVAVDYKFDGTQFYSLKGETVMGEQFEEYYIEEDALYELILEIFYEPAGK